MNQRTLLIVAVIIIVVGGIYYHQHTHTTSLDLPGGKSVSVTTHN